MKAVVQLIHLPSSHVHAKFTGAVLLKVFFILKEIQFSIDFHNRYKETGSKLFVRLVMLKR